MGIADASKYPKAMVDGAALLGLSQKTLDTFTAGDVVHWDSPMTFTSS